MLKLKGQSKLESAAEESGRGADNQLDEFHQSVITEDDGISPHEPKKIFVSYRNLVYIFVWIVLITWQFFLGLGIIIEQFKNLNNGVEIEQEYFQDFELWNSITGLFGSFILAPLPLVMPPLCKKRSSRLYLKLFLVVANILCFAVHFVSGLGWVYVVPKEKLYRLFTVLILQEFSSVAILFGFSIMMWRIVTRIKTGDSLSKPSGKGFAVDLMIFFGCMIFLSIDQNLDGVSLFRVEQNDALKFQRAPNFEKLVPLHQLCWLFLIFQQHFLRKHVGWYTYARCRARVEEQLKIQGLDPVQIDLLKQRPFGIRLIEGSLQTRLFNKNLCPC